MIENLLADPEVIWQAIVTVRHKTAFRNQREVETALDSILDNLSEHEISRRVKSGVGFHSFRLHDPVSTASEQVAEHVRQVENSASESVIGELRIGAEKQVAKLEEERTRRENYDGKKILAEFYGKHLRTSPMPKELFIYECARAAATRQSVKRFVEDLLDRITSSG